MPDAHRCGSGRKWPWIRVPRSPAIPDPSDRGSGALHGNHCTPGRAGDSGFHRLPMHAFQISLADLRVALAARSRNIPVINFGARVFRRQNSVATVTIGTGCSCAVSVHHCSAMHTLFVEFNRMSKGNLVPRKKLRVAVTRCASVWQIFFRYQGSRFARGLNLMH